MRTLLVLAAALPAFALGQVPSRAPPGAPPPYPGAPPPGAGAQPRVFQQAPQAQPAPTAQPAQPAQRPAAAPRAQTAAPGVQPAQPGRPGSAVVTPAPDAEAGNAGGSARADGRCVPLTGRFLLAFNKAEIVDVLEQASRWTCRNFAYTEDVARGKITLLSKTPVTAEEAYAAFLAALTANNIAVYPSGKYYKLVRIADAKKTPIPTYLEDGTEAPALEQPITKVFKLRYADPDQLRGIMGNFTSPQGADIQSIPPDTLIITDIGLNVRRIERMLEAIDRPGQGELIRLIQVKYASARDLADKVNQVFQASPGQPGKPGRRPVIGGVAPAPGQPAPAAPAAGGEGAGELSISKVLADERTNKLVVIADEKSFQRIKDLVEQLDLPTAGEGQIHVLFMKNASAEDLAQTLQALAQGQSSVRRTGGGAPGAPGQPFVPPNLQAAQAAGAGGATANLFAGEVKITADKVSNALIVMASGSDYATVQRLVEKLDRPRRQVFVEAVIMEVNLRDELQFGVSAHTAIPYKTSDGTGFIPLASETGRVNSFNPLGAVSLGGFLSGLVGPVSAELKDVLPGVSSLAVLVQALQTNSDVNVLSTPHILASDNEDAEITVGQNVPFQAGFQPQGLNLSGTTTTAGGASAASIIGAGAIANQGIGSLFAPIQRQNVELRLRVKPQITEGDNVRLTLDEQTEEIVDRDPSLGPTTAKRSVKTNISVKDQATIVIGGLIQERSVSSVKKIPLLGDIPVLGWLFRDTQTTKQKSNLLLFLTPYIIRDQSDYRRILERKRKEQQDFVEQFYGGKGPQYNIYVDYARKAGPYTKVHRDVETETLKLENGGPGAPGEGSVSPGGRGVPPAAPPGSAAPAPAPAPRGAVPAPRGEEPEDAPGLAPPGSE
jgi:general secretion pathway protein D